MGKIEPVYRRRVSSSPKNTSPNPIRLQNSQDSNVYPTIRPKPKHMQQHPCKLFFRHIKTPPAESYAGGV